jgi:predicted small secreted protein
MVVVLIIAAVVIGGVVAVGGGHSVAGFGQDVKQTGDKIQGK